MIRKKIKVKYIFTPLNLDAKLEFAHFQTLIQFGSQTLKVNIYSP